MEVQTLIDQCSDWLIKFEYLISQFPQVDPDSLFAGIKLPFPIQEKECGFKLIGDFIIEFSTIEGVISWLYEQPKFSHLNDKQNRNLVESSLKRIQIIWGEVEEHKEKVDLFRKINSFRNKITHKLLGLENLKQIENNIDLCREWLNLVLPAEEKMEYKWISIN